MRTFQLKSVFLRTNDIKVVIIVVMTQALKKIRATILLVMLIEILVYGGMVALFEFDIPQGFKDFMTIDKWILSLGSSIVLDLVLFWIAFLGVSRIRQKSDLQAASLIGGDVQEAYNFGQLGLVVVDDKGIVLWYSNLLKDRNIALLDENIFGKFPALRELVEATPESTIKVDINSHMYEVKYLQVAKLFIFKDCTDYEKVFKYSRDQATVIGYITIDNFNEISGGEEDNNEVFAKVRQEIVDYAHENGVLLRKFRSDSYLAICNRVALEKMQSDSFSILARARNIGKSSDITPTLSIGFAFDFPEVDKLNEMASDALDIALSRGGDQAVVSQYGDDLTFYGGNTAAVESTSNIKVRSMADSLIALIKASQDVFVMGHAELDMDALGASFGIKTICKHLNIPCKIVYDPKNSELKTKFAMQSTFTNAELEEITISPRAAIDSIKESTLLLVVDVTNPRMVLSNELLDRASKVVLLDHHRRGENFIDHAVLSYIEPSASSSSEMVTELIKFSTCNPKIEIEQTAATIMLSGIFLDTNFFKSKSTGRRTFDAAEYLKKYGADNGKADDYLKEEFEEYSLITSIVSSMKTPYFGVVYCVSSDKDIIERSMLAKVANQLLQLKGINACFVIGRTNSNEIRISARSDGTINVQLLAEKLGGGGHYMSAAASFENQTIEFAENKLLETLEEYLASAKAVEKEGVN